MCASGISDWSEFQRQEEPGKEYSEKSGKEESKVCKKYEALIWKTTKKAMMKSSQKANKTEKLETEKKFFSISSFSVFRCTDIV